MVLFWGDATRAIEAETLQVRLLLVTHIYVKSLYATACGITGGDVSAVALGPPLSAVPEQEPIYSVKVNTCVAKGVLQVRAFDA